ncbi:WYL domain-containing protein [Myxococcota bacterium]|nr:WYL domain-containing protein [Myxococcota bacterium]
MKTYSQPWANEVLLPPGNTPVEEITFSVFDTETCGLWTGSRVVEIGLYQVKNNTVITSRSWLINPQMPIPAGAMAVHNITDEEVADAPSAGVVIREILPLLEDTILVAHNAPYDEGIVATNAARYGVFLPPLPIIDTIPLAKALIANMDSYSLAHLSKTLGFEAPQYHRALSDAQTTSQLLGRCTEILKKLQENDFYHLANYGTLSRLGNSARPVTEWPGRFPLLHLAISTQAEMEISYLKDNVRIRIPATLMAIFEHKGHTYLEVRDHRHIREIRSLRLDRIQAMVPIS